MHAQSLLERRRSADVSPEIAGRAAERICAPRQPYRPPLRGWKQDVVRASIADRVEVVTGQRAGVRGQSTGSAAA
jgi:hypothetical protein